jgi:hypothetical protein
MVARKRERESASSPPLVDAELADELLARAQSGGVELLGPDALLSQVTKAVLEWALAEEMTAHLGYEKHDPAGRGSGNSRNGSVVPARSPSCSADARTFPQPENLAITAMWRTYMSTTSMAFTAGPSLPVPWC